MGELWRSIRYSGLAFLLLIISRHAAFAQGDGHYVLGPLDTITVDVLRHVEFSGDFTIPDSGIVDLPGVGPIKLSGMELAQASEAIRAKLSKRLRSPEVSVSIKQPRSAGISILGDVRLPGVHPWRPGWRITDALGAGGGVPDGVRIIDCTVTVIRSGSDKRESVPLQEALAGDPAKNLPVYPGDVITITSPDQVSVYVYGAVKSPGVYHFPAGSATAAQAIIAAGGPTESAVYSLVHVTHLSDEKYDVDMTPSILHGEPVNAPQLQAGDIVQVPEARDKIGVFGSVTAPGVYVMPFGHAVTLADAITLARGPVKASRLGKVAISHPEPGGKEHHRIYDLSKYYKVGDQSQNPVLIAGDVVFVPESPGRVDWTTVLSAAVSIAIISEVLRG